MHYPLGCLSCHACCPKLNVFFIMNGRILRFQYSELMFLWSVILIQIKKETTAGKDHPPLSWETRMRITLCSARGLAFLHEECMFMSCRILLINITFLVLVGEFMIMYLNPLKFICLGRSPQDHTSRYQGLQYSCRWQFWCKGGMDNSTSVCVYCVHQSAVVF